MPDTQPPLSFVPWLRRGAATQITTTPTDGRATVQARVELSGSGAGPVVAERSVELKGPGDIVGFDVRAVVRTWPPANTFEAEPNLFPAIELAAPDLPWRYTPGAPDGPGRLQPWLTLIVASETGETSEIVSRHPPSRTKPLPSAVVAISALSRLSQAAAWAHVHLVGAPEDVGTIAREDSSRAVSRLLCPRRLKPRTIYHALLVPTYDVGRRAGLGQDTQGILATARAWEDDPAETELPIYYEWRFGTGDAADFEQLARKLEPRPLPPSVGTRPMDISAPGAGLPSGSPSQLPLPGALERLDAEPVVPPAATDPFVVALRERLNALTDLIQTGTGDPVVAPPLYGRWYAAQERTAADAGPDWFRDLNSDPRWRVAAGLGTLVVQKNDRALMAAAWARAPQLKIANEILLQALVARAGAGRLHARHFTATRALPQGASERVLQLAGGALSRVRAGGKTVRAVVRDSAVGDEIFDRAWRVLVRPRSPLGRKQVRGQTVFESISSRLNRGAVLAAFPPELLQNTATIVTIGNLLAPASARGAYMKAYEKLSRETSLVPMILLVGSLLPDDGKAYYDDEPWKQMLQEAQSGNAPKPEAAAAVVGAIPAWSKFEPVEYIGKDTKDPRSGSEMKDADFRDAVSVLLDGLGSRPKTAQKPPAIDLDALRETVLAALDPNETIPAGALPRVGIAPELGWAPHDPLEPLLVRPSFEQPMYEPLRELGHEWLLPGLSAVPTDTVSLVRTNQAFVEAYMLGLNQEVNRELLWNEYPTDQRHTFFRQFWDTAGHASPVGTVVHPDELRDIRRIHEWTGTLGSHSARAGLASQTVLLLRSELLRRYPNALVYATRANPSTGPLTGSPEVHPVFSGTLPPDVSFFGFELSRAQLEETDSTTGAIWYFVVQEQPSEPKFGLDSSASGSTGSWDDLSWDHVQSDNYIDLEQPFNGSPSFPGSPAWNWDVTDASQIAWITYQKPVRFAVPATQLLEGL